MANETLTTSDAPPSINGETPAIAFEGVSLAFDDHVVLKRISFTILPGRMKICVGASGSGKSTILRLILGLLRPDEGAIWVHGKRVDQLSEAELMPVRAELGMV